MYVMGLFYRIPKGQDILCHLKRSSFLEQLFLILEFCFQAVYLRRDKENWLRQSVEDLEEDLHHLQHQSPLPIIDGLSWQNLDEQASAHEPVNTISYINQGIL